MGRQTYTKRDSRGREKQRKREKETERDAQRDRDIVPDRGTDKQTKRGIYMRTINQL